MGIATEAEIQQTIVEGLEWRTFIVLATDRPRFACSQCGAVRQLGDGVSKGLPDVMFTHRDWPLGLWGGIEVKKDAKASVRAEQRMLQTGGRILVTWEPEEAWDFANTLHLFLMDAWAEHTNLPPGVHSAIQEFTLRWAHLHE